MTKTGTSLTILDGANTYAGSTTINGGTLRADEGTATVFRGLPWASNLSISNGVWEMSTSPANHLFSTGTLAITGGTSGFSAYAAAVTLSGLNGGSTVQWDTGGFAPTTLVLNEATALSALSWSDNIDLNSATARTINVNATGTTTAATPPPATLSGVISNTLGAGGLTKGGAGTLILSNAGNTWTGPLAIQQGMVSVASLADSGTGSNGDTTISLGNAANTGALQYTGSAAVTLNATPRSIDLAGTTGGAIIDASGSGALTINSPITATGAAPRPSPCKAATPALIPSAAPSPTAAAGPPRF